ncbi:MFS general substrate transporter [Melanogaster broomeanus]|nr:MFS general substrate transporter [Melanogaster broomeanus]
MQPSPDDQHHLLESSAIPDYDSIGTSRVDDLDDVFGGVEGRKILEKRLLRKLDLRVAFLFLISIMNYLDRYNAAAARLRGLEDDLHMTGSQFNTLVSTFYVGYVLMQVPSNIFLSSIQRPSLYLSVCVFLAGVCSIATGSFAGALTSRFFLGLCEAAWYPGTTFLLSKWYKRSELAWRIAITTSGATISYAFGALVASVVMDMTDKVFGFAGWRWLFLLEGSVTIIIAIFAIFTIPDYPSSPVSWLTHEEHLLALRRVEEDDADSLEQDKLVSGLIAALSDWRVWWLSIAQLCLYAASSFGNFFPTLVATMGYGPTVSLLLCAPPWIFSTMMTFVISWHSDVSRERFWHVSIPVMIGIAGFVLAMNTMNTVLRYLSFFLMTPIDPGVLITWASNSFPHSSSKRAVGIAIVNSVAMTGNIGAAYFWPSSWGPSYFRSYLLCILASVIVLVILWRYRSSLEEANKAAEEEERLKGLPVVSGTFCEEPVHRIRRVYDSLRLFMCFQCEQLSHAYHL